MPKKKQKTKISYTHIRNPATPILIALDGKKFYTLCEACLKSTNVRSAQQCRIVLGHKAPDGRNSTTRGKGRQFPNHLVGHDAPYTEAADGVIEDTSDAVVTVADMLEVCPGMLDPFPGSDKREKLLSFQELFNFHLAQQRESDALACSPKPGPGRSRACGSTGKTRASGSPRRTRCTPCNRVNEGHAHTQA